MRQTSILFSLLILFSLVPPVKQPALVPHNQIIPSSKSLMPSNRALDPNAVMDNWEPLANGGLDGYVYAMAVYDGVLYVGGSFTQTVDGAVKNLHNIAIYSNGQWKALANRGLDSSVSALAFTREGDLYVGGSFNSTVDQAVRNLGHIALYTGGQWTPLPNRGLDNNVLALLVSGGDLYVGGQFGSTGDGKFQDLNRIARYSTGEWQPLANAGLNTSVQTMAFSQGNLYVGGDFTRTFDREITGLNHIARYNPISNKWIPLTNEGLNDQVSALAFLGNDLYIGGNFSRTSDGTVTNLFNIARYSNGTWAALNEYGLNGVVNSLQPSLSGRNLYIGGNFTQTIAGYTIELNHIARYNRRTAWQPLNGDSSIDGSVIEIAVIGLDLYISAIRNLGDYIYEPILVRITSNQSSTNP